MAPPTQGNQDIVTQAAIANGVDPNTMLGIYQVESNNGANTTSQTGVQGPFQITQATWNQWNPGVPYSTDLAAQADTAARIMADNNARYDGVDPSGNLALFAYNAGDGTANIAAKAIQNGSSVGDAEAAATAQVFPNNPGKVAEATQYGNKVQTAAGNAQAGSTGNTSGASGSTNVGVDNPTVSAYQGLQNNGNQVSTQTIQELSQPLVITDGLDVTPWFQDTSLVIGNRPARSKVTPVSFQVVLMDQKGFTMLGPNGYPITLQLNVSMKRHSLTERHIYHAQRTRTGWHITLWGMQADTIQGECTTGVFMNQFGLTDFFSMSTISSDVKNLISKGFSKNPKVAQTASSSSLRVAAQDAFMEFLMLFKMNGVVWVYNQSIAKSSASTSGTLNQQAGPAVWSPQLANNSTQTNARGNDVLTRGNIIFNFRENLYLGYFKSLNWTQSATKPYSWDFSFVFQVEKTLSLVYSPLQNIPNSGSVSGGTITSQTGI